MKKRVLSQIGAALLAVLLLSVPLAVSASGDVYETAEKRIFQNADTVLPYRLILPESYDASKTYPMLVFLHGAGERGDDNELQLYHCVQYLADNMPNCIIVAPQCPQNEQWVDTPWSKGAYSVEEVPESNELIAVMELLSELQTEFSVDADRIYASGISMGGFGTWDLMMRHNDYFAAGIAVCGGGDPSQAEVLVDTPLYVFHGDADPSVPVSGSRDTVQAIKDAGGTQVRYVEYAGAGHGIWNDAFATSGLLHQLQEQKLSDRYPEKAPVSEAPSEAESSVQSAVSEAESVASEPASEPASGMLPILLTVFAVLAVAAAVTVAIVMVRRK